jgi:hypothetical protein
MYRLKASATLAFSPFWLDDPTKALLTIDRIPRATQALAPLAPKT